MTEQTSGKKIDGSKTRSSMGVSQQIMCEGEACIGMGDPPVSAPAPVTEGSAKKKKQASGSSMAVGGKEICSDDACIGRD